MRLHNTPKSSESTRFSTRTVQNGGCAPGDGTQHRGVEPPNLLTDQKTPGMPDEHLMMYFFFIFFNFFIIYFCLTDIY